MEIKTLSPSFALTGVIDTATILSYSECFAEAGKLFISLPFTTEHYQLLKPPCRILVEDLIFNVDKIQATSEQIRVYGSGIFSELKQFYIASPEEQNGAPCDILYDFASRVSFEGISYAVYGIATKDERVHEGYEWCTDLCTIISQLCYDYDLGFRMSYSFDTRELGFHIFSVRDRATSEASTFTTICDGVGAFSKIESIYDVTNYKNYVELVYLLRAYDKVDSVVYNRCAEGESIRGYCEHFAYPFLSNTPQAVCDARARQIFKAHRKRRQFRATLNGAPQHRIGDLCYVKSEALGEMAYALLTEREISVINGARQEVLILEVQ